MYKTSNKSALSRIIWRDIYTEALEAVLLFSSSFFNLAPFYADKKIMLLAVRFPRDARHFMREKSIMRITSGQRQIDEVRCRAIL